MEYSYGLIRVEQIKNIRNSFTIDTKEDEFIFTGVVRYTPESLRVLKRSNYGRGADFMFAIKEYIGENCYIPTDGNCFIKCVNYLLQHKRNWRNILEELSLSMYDHDEKKINDHGANTDPWAIYHDKDNRRTCLVAKDIER
jgi:hypothetical protein